MSIALDQPVRDAIIAGIYALRSQIATYMGNVNISGRVDDGHTTFWLELIERDTRYVETLQQMIAIPLADSTKAAQQSEAA